MRKKRNSLYFENIGSVIDGLVEDLGLEKGLKISSICKFWSKIVGPRFEKTSKIFSIYKTKGFDSALIAVSSSSAVNELTIYRNDVLRKLHRVGENFGFNIKEIKFSTKHWEIEKIEEKKPVKILINEEIEKTELPSSLLCSIKASMDEKDFFNKELKDRFLKTIIKDLKTHAQNAEFLYL